MKYLAEIEESLANELEEQVNEDHTTHWPETEETSYMKKKTITTYYSTVSKATSKTVNIITIQIR